MGRVWSYIAGDGAKPGTGDAAYEVSAQVTSKPRRAKRDDWGDDPVRRYPPNAFLTYYALSGLRLTGGGVFPEGYAERLSRVRLWLASSLSFETAQSLDGSPDADPQQLAWAVSGLIASDSTALSDRAEGNVLRRVEAGLRQFFAMQRDNGTWAIGRALFHYPEAGNAYCYIYETLAELLGLALDSDAAYADEARSLLTPYLPQLLAADAHLDRTARNLGEGRFGWSSGHHPHRTAPEGWATATAFRYRQHLRQMVSAEVVRRSKATLKARGPRAKNTLDDPRWATWGAPGGSLGELLNKEMVQPTQDAKQSRHDPDKPAIPESAWRSAILFGPPGTGKTSLAEAVAAELKWDFVEITPADFLQEGIDRVSARADEVFSALMDLDRCVVLLDELDELIHTRANGKNGSDQANGVEGEALSRWFTTTMLPRLTRLWNSRRVVFFANTNGIELVDPAIRRSQRFDALLFVGTPGYSSKVEWIDKGLRNRVPSLAEIEALGKAVPDEVAADVDPRWSWVPFLQFNQRDAIAQISGWEDLLGTVERLGIATALDWEVFNSDAQDPRAAANKWLANAARFVKPKESTAS
jgi:hypothetical protein